MRERPLAAVVLAFTIQVAAQETSPSFSRWTTLCEGVEHTAGAALGDLDGDGDLDLILSNGRHINELDWVYTNTGAGKFYGKRALSSDPDPSYAIALGDLDNDGDLDAVVANDSFAWSYIYLNDGRGNFNRVAGLGAPRPPQPRRAVRLAISTATVTSMQYWSAKVRITFI